MLDLRAKGKFLKLKQGQHLSTRQTSVHSSVVAPSLRKRKVPGSNPTMGKIFSAPEPKAQVHYCDHALSVVHRPSVRPSLNFNIFDFSSATAERNSTKLDRKQDLNVLYKVCFSGRSEKQDGRPDLWLAETFWLLLWKRWTEFNETWQEARSQCPLPSLYFSGRSEKQDGRPGLWLPATFLTSPLKPLNGIQRTLSGIKISTSSTKFVFFGPIGKNKIAALASYWLRHFGLLLWNQLNGIQRILTGSKISMSSTNFVFFGPIGKTRWPPWPLITWHILDFSSETAERNSTNLVGKQDLNVLYQVCDFRADRKKQDGRPGLWLAETFWTSPLKPAERNSTKLNRKQDLNVLYQVCVFRADRKNKMAALASDYLTHFGLLLWNRWTEFNETWSKISSSSTKFVCFGPIGKNKMAALASYLLRHFRLFLWNRWMEFNETWQEARSQRPLPSLWFLDRSEKQHGRPGLWMAETFSTSPLKLLIGIERNLTGSKITMSSTKFFGPIRKQKWPPWLIRQKGGTLYSGARYVALWASCFHYVIIARRAFLTAPGGPCKCNQPWHTPS